MFKPTGTGMESSFQRWEKGSSRKHTTGNGYEQLAKICL